MEFILIILSSILFTIPLYSPSLFFLSWFAFIPLIYLTSDYDYSHSFIIAVLVGFLNSLFSFYWLYQPLNESLAMPFSFNIFILFIYFLISALPLALWLLINKFLQPKYSFSPIIAALSWGSLEFLRFKYLNINPLNYLAYTQSSFSWISQYASFGGIFLVSTLTVLIGAYLFKIFLEPSLKRSIPLIIIFILIIVIPIFYNSAQEKGYEYQKVDLLVKNSEINNNIFEKLEQEINLLAELSKKAQSNYIFTAEDSISFDLLRNNFYRNKLFSQLGDDLADSYLQLGTITSADGSYNSEIFNSLFLFDGDFNQLNRYNKESSIVEAVNLPYKEQLFSMIDDYLNFKYTNTDNELKQFEVAELSYLNLISDEIFIPILSKNYDLENKFNLIVNSAEEKINSRVYSNLSFGAAVFRAAESNKTVIRVVSGGYSGYITPEAKIGMKKIIENDIKTINIPLIKKESYYQKYPDRIITIILLLTSLIVLIKSIIIIKNKISSRN